MLKLFSFRSNSSFMFLYCSFSSFSFSISNSLRPRIYSYRLVPLFRRPFHGPLRSGFSRGRSGSQDYSSPWIPFIIYISLTSLRSSFHPASVCTSPWTHVIAEIATPSSSRSAPLSLQMLSDSASASTTRYGRYWSQIVSCLRPSAPDSLGRFASCLLRRLGTVPACFLDSSAATASKT